VDTIEIPCPACGTINRIPEDAIPESGEVPCMACGDRISFRAAPRGTTGTFRVPGTPLPPPPGPKNLLDDFLADEDAGTGGHRVTCPRCGHVFDPEAEGQGRKTVLVVEDTDFFLYLATEVLGRRYHTIGVRTAAEAREVLATRPVDLVVLDLTLPDAEGTDVLRALPRPDIPVLVYTSRDETSLLGQEWAILQSLGANDVVHKGINIEDTLLRKADELLAARPVT